MGNACRKREKSEEAINYDDDAVSVEVGEAPKSVNLAKTPSSEESIEESSLKVREEILEFIGYDEQGHVLLLPAELSEGTEIQNLLDQQTNQKGRIHFNVSRRLFRWPSRNLTGMEVLVSVRQGEYGKAFEEAWPRRKSPMIRSVGPMDEKGELSKIESSSKTTSKKGKEAREDKETPSKAADDTDAAEEKISEPIIRDVSSKKLSKEPPKGILEPPKLTENEGETHESDSGNENEDDHIEEPGDRESHAGPTKAFVAGPGNDPKIERKNHNKGLVK